MVDEQRADGASQTNMPKQRGHETRHGGEEGREVRKSTNGSEKRARRGTDRKDARNDIVGAHAVGPNDVDADTSERKKREAVTETRQT